jgi:ABC-type glycerol-3-phosphate transport system permease component
MADKVTSLPNLIAARENRPLKDRLRGTPLWEWGQTIGRHLLLAPLTILFLFPWFWMITTSLKSPEQILVFPPQWIPNPASLKAYPEAFADAQMLLYGRNTLFLCIVNVIGAVLSNCLVAYGFSRIRWPGRDIVFWGVLATMMLPYQVRMVPLYIVFAKLNWVNTYLPLTVPTYFGSAFFIFMLRQFFRTIPDDLTDAARIDGASELRILWSIFVPLVKPAIAVIALFEFIGNWNAFLEPLIYLNDSKLWTLTLGILGLRMQYGLSNYATIMAAICMALAPIVILFFLTQRTFIEGIALTGLKG